MHLSDISNIILPYKKILVAFSGGLDSTVLLHLLMCWRERDPEVELRAIHVHHGLSIYADSWVIHCKQVCQDWNIPLLVEYVTLSENKLNFEKQARQARYAVFAKNLLNKEILVTAQHLEDQSETFLLALKRGSGPLGLSSMSFCSKFHDTKLLRPLLNKTRSSLLSWAKNNSLNWIEDESNHNDYYDRNFLRLKILPLLTNRWPHFNRAVARSALLCAEQETLLDELLSDELKILIKDGKLNIKPLLTMSAVHRSALQRRWLATYGISMPSRKVLHIIWKEIVQARKDATPCLHINGYEIRRFRNFLWLIKRYSSLRNIVIDWPDIRSSLALPNNAGYVKLTVSGNIRFPVQHEKVSIRFNANGLLHIIGRNRGRRLKKIWQEKNVPPWIRNIIPLLFYNENLIAAANGIFITKEGWTKSGLKMEWRQNNFIGI